MKIKTSELTGVALDWAVAQCEGVKVKVPDGWTRPLAKVEHCRRFPFGPPAWEPSVDWDIAGPIIERERINIWHRRDLAKHNISVGWAAAAYFIGSEQTGSTPLIAAMRAYAASKLGEEVDVPEELME